MAQVQRQHNSRAELGQLLTFWLEPGCHYQLSVLKALLPTPLLPSKLPIAPPQSLFWLQL